MKHRIRVFLLFALIFAVAGVGVFAAGSLAGTDLTWDYNDTTQTLTLEGSGELPELAWNETPWADETVRHIVLGDGVTAVSVQTLHDSARYLEDFEVDTDNPYLKAEDGVLFSKDGKTLLSYPFEKTVEGDLYRVPDGVETIAPYGFYRAQLLYGLKMPESLTAIGDHAFDSWIYVLELPAGISQIGDGMSFTDLHVAFGGSETDWAALSIEGSTEASLRSADIRCNTSLAPLPGVTELGWGKERRRTSSGETLVDREGSLYYKRPDNFSYDRYTNGCMIRFYRVGEGGVDLKVGDMWSNFGSSYVYTSWLLTGNTFPDGLEEGDYYFTVQPTVNSLRGAFPYIDGVPVKSEVWHFDGPAEALPVPTSLHYDERTTIFTWEEETELDEQKDYDFLWQCFSSDEQVAEPVWQDDRSGTNTDGSSPYGSAAWYLYSEPQYMWLRVRAVSQDLMKSANSAWSEPIGPFYASTPNTDGLTSYAAENGNIWFDPESGAIVLADEDVTEVEIPETIGGVAVTAIGTGAFHEHYSLRSVSLPASVTSIGGAAFANCSSLAELELPEGLSSIGPEAFDRCWELSTVRYGGSFVSGRAIGLQDAFQDSYTCEIIYGIDDYGDLKLPAVTAWRWSDEYPGTLEFQMPQGDPAWEDVYMEARLYRTGSDEAVDISGYDGWVEDPDEWIWEDALYLENDILMPGETSDFYYVLQYVDDLGVYAPGDEVRTSSFTVRAANRRLATPAIVSWDGTKVVVAPYSAAECDYLLVKFGIKDSKTGRMREVRAISRNTKDSQGNAVFAVPANFTERYKGQTVYCRVMAVTKDITVALTSEDSAWTDGVVISSAASDLAAIADGLSESSGAAARRAAVDQVRALDKAGLASALASEDAAADLAKIESLTNGVRSVTVGVDVRSALPSELRQALGSGGSKVSAVGTGLNAEEGQSVDLVIDKAGEGLAEKPSTVYHKVVQFSADVQDSTSGQSVAGEGGLAVPVLVEMAVPDYFREDLISVTDGSGKKVDVTLSQSGGDTLASFVLTDATDFTMEQQNIAAEKTDDGVDITAIITDGDMENAQNLLYAVYDENGRMISVDMATAASRLDGVSLDCDADAASDVQILRVSGGLTPTAESLEVSVK